MKKDYQKPVINSTFNVKSPHLLAGSQGEEVICTTDNSCPTYSGGGL